MPGNPSQSKPNNTRLEVPASKARSRRTSPHAADRSVQPNVIVEAQATVEGAAGTSHSIRNEDNYHAVPNTIAFIDRLPPLIDALDTLAHVHPFLQVAVGAFRVIAEFELKRFGNDKRVSMLFFEMQNMMHALLQLQPVRANHVGHDGISIGERLADLVKKTAEDINECAKTCDAYANQRLLAKVFNAPSWDITFREYTQRFSIRKAEITFAISIHTGIRVDRANEKLDALADKMDAVLGFFNEASHSNITENAGIQTTWSGLRGRATPSPRRRSTSVRGRPRATPSRGADPTSRAWRGRGRSLQPGRGTGRDLTGNSSDARGSSRGNKAGGERANSRGRGGTGGRQPRCGRTRPARRGHHTANDGRE